jgi:hypothetical protein
MKKEVFRVKRYPLHKFNAVNTVELPAESAVLGMMTNETDPKFGVVQLLIEIPVLADSAKEQETEKHKFLLIHDDSPYGNLLEDDQELMYIGSGSWDNGYRIIHVFEIMDWSLNEVEDVEEEESVDMEKFVQMAVASALEEQLKDNKQEVTEAEVIDVKLESTEEETEE